MRRFIENAESYIKLLRAHITKENTILFPMGDKLLSKEIQDELLESFEGYEEKVMGKEHTRSSMKCFISLGMNT